jgi:hypothetical protein
LQPHQSQGKARRRTRCAAFWDDAAQNATAFCFAIDYCQPILLLQLSTSATTNPLVSSNVSNTQHEAAATKWRTPAKPHKAGGLTSAPSQQQAPLPKGLIDEDGDHAMSPAPAVSSQQPTSTPSSVSEAVGPRCTHVCVSALGEEGRRLPHRFPQGWQQCNYMAEVHPHALQCWFNQPLTGRPYLTLLSPTYRCFPSSMSGTSCSTG